MNSYLHFPAIHCSNAQCRALCNTHSSKLPGFYFDLFPKKKKTLCIVSADNSPDTITSITIINRSYPYFSPKTENAFVCAGNCLCVEKKIYHVIEQVE